MSALKAVRSEKAKSFIEEYYTTNNLTVSEKFPMGLIAKNFDEEELLGKNWLGILTLDNEIERKIFEEYIKF